MARNPLRASAVRAALRRAWRDSVAGHQALVQVNRPWEAEGPLRWQRRVGGWELHGHHLETDR